MKRKQKSNKTKHRKRVNGLVSEYARLFVPNVNAISGSESQVFEQPSELVTFKEEFTTYGIHDPRPVVSYPNATMERNA